MSKSNFGRNPASKQKYIYLCPADFDTLYTEDDEEYIKRNLDVDLGRNMYELDEGDIY